ncbi:hypothetical protein CPB84DRAFT_1785757 [Gymnopilus junonius]|uniref:Uncharacterized protein n=1 Tax=Gymnopilus junonius TaxID=109634 RepID=A0A9P5NIT1_GYMJU|nr:hypothetical protein CPB84DRAFT_1785757 [Gymnopilus junonius]
MYTARTPSPGPAYDIADWDADHHFPPWYTDYHYEQPDPGPYNQVPPSPRIIEDRPLPVSQVSYPAVHHQTNQSTYIPTAHGRYHPDPGALTLPPRFQGHWTPPPSPSLPHRSTNQTPSRQLQPDSRPASSVHIDDGNNNARYLDFPVGDSRNRERAGGRIDHRFSNLEYVDDGWVHSRVDVLQPQQRQESSLFNQSMLPHTAVPVHPAVPFHPAAPLPLASSLRYQSQGDRRFEYQDGHEHTMDSSVSPGRSSTSVSRSGRKPRS